MSLADYVPQRAQVTVNRRPLAEVRGLNLDDVATLISKHLDDLRRVYDFLKIQEGVPTLDLTNVEDVVVRLLLDFPAVTAQAIALACDEPDQAARVRVMPLPVQVTFMLEIMRLTFEDVGGPKVFVALVANLVRKQLPSGTATINPIA